jgi:hypothetical protein
MNDSDLRTSDASAKESMSDLPSLYASFSPLFPLIMIKSSGMANPIAALGYLCHVLAMCFRSLVPSLNPCSKPREGSLMGAFKLQGNKENPIFAYSTARACCVGLSVDCVNFIKPWQLYLLEAHL